MSLPEGKKPYNKVRAPPVLHIYINRCIYMQRVQGTNRLVARANNPGTRPLRGHPYMVMVTMFWLKMYL